MNHVYCVEYHIFFKLIIEPIKYIITHIHNNFS